MSCAVVKLLDRLEKGGHPRLLSLSFLMFCEGVEAIRIFCSALTLHFLVCLFNDLLDVFLSFARGAYKAGFGGNSRFVKGAEPTHGLLFLQSKLAIFLLLPLFLIFGASCLFFL